VKAVAVRASTAEAERIRAEYARREGIHPPDFYSLTRPANLFAQQQRDRHMLDVLRREKLLPLSGQRILDIGCGDGQQLLRFESWGAAIAALSGIDLVETRVARAVERFGGTSQPGRPELRVGDASALPWPDGHFDIVHQSTVFTSILDSPMKAAVAAEMLRVLRPGGAVIWYDFFVNNPANPHVRGVGATELRSLFPGCHVRTRRITLAPPISRRLVPVSWIASLLLEHLRVLNTHYLAVIRRPVL